MMHLDLCARQELQATYVRLKGRVPLDASGLSMEAQAGLVMSRHDASGWRQAECWSASRWLDVDGGRAGKVRSLPGGSEDGSEDCARPDRG
jgi:hypothetical protein